jgi:ubiquinone/menaquinone biosynthesis C-methylase UbiE
LAFVTVNDDQATSFGSVADRYDRVRPAPPAAAMDWLVPADCAVAVDVAAGTGLFTRELLARATRVVAVEPDTRMREVLARRSPDIDVKEGWGEAIPLPDASADAVFVSTAWHWLDLPRAVPEIARVLRPGGRLGIVWTSRDRQVDWVAELDLLRMPEAAGSGEPATPAEVREELVRHHAVNLPAGSPFGPAETASFGVTRTMAVADVLDWLATNSAFITSSPASQAASRARCEEALLSRATTPPGGTVPVVEMPTRSWCWRAARS